jgi:hypothetical protein
MIKKQSYRISSCNIIIFITSFLLTYLLYIFYGDRFGPEAFINGLIMFTVCTFLYIGTVYFIPLKIDTLNVVDYLKRIIVISGILDTLSIIFLIVPFLIVYPTCGNTPPCSHPLVPYIIHDYYIILIGSLGVISLLWFPVAVSQFIYTIVKNKSLKNNIYYQVILLGFLLILLFSHGALTYLINRL